MSKETKAVKGIDVTLDPEMLEDWEVVNDLMTLADDEDDGKDTVEKSKERLAAINRIADVLYGKDFEKFKKKLRSANGGKLPISLVVGFINETFDVFRKN